MLRPAAALDRVFARFEALYPPTVLAADRQPPPGTAAFFGYFLRQFRGALVARFVVVALGSVADAMLPIFVGWTVGMLTTTEPGRMATPYRTSTRSPSTRVGVIDGPDTRAIPNCRPDPATARSLLVVPTAVPLTRPPAFAPAAG